MSAGTPNDAAREAVGSSGTAVILRFQNAKREELLDGMSIIIRRMTRVAPRGDLVLADHNERELSIALLSYLEGVQP